MKRTLIALLLLSLPVAYLAWWSQKVAAQVASSDPTVWEEAIAAFETTPGDTPAEAFLFVGSSSIRLWRTLHEDMAPLPVIQRGFGGSRIGDVLHYADRLITRFDPSAVIVFVGSNDINVTETPQQAMTAVPVIADGFEQLVDTIHANRADTQIFWIDITATRFSWDKLAAVDAANAAVGKICAARRQVHCIHTRDIFVNNRGELDDSLFVLDGLHLNSSGYSRWTERIKPVLQGTVVEVASP